MQSKLISLQTEIRKTMDSEAKEEGKLGRMGAHDISIRLWVRESVQQQKRETVPPLLIYCPYHATFRVSVLVSSADKTAQVRQYVIPCL